MGALSYIAAVIFAVFFIGVGFALYSEYQRGAAERDFVYRAGLLAERIDALGAQSSGAVDYFGISIPSNCELRFTDNVVTAVVGEHLENFRVGFPVSGPTFTNQKLNLKLERTENGVDVSEA